MALKVHLGELDLAMEKLLNDAFEVLWNMYKMALDSREPCDLSEECENAKEQLNEVRRMFEESWEELMTDQSAQKGDMFEAFGRRSDVLKKAHQMRPGWPKKKQCYLEMPSFNDRKITERVETQSTWSDVDDDDQSSDWWWKLQHFPEYFREGVSASGRWW